MNYLGIDFGLKYIGVAFSQGILAEPIDQITHNGDDEYVIERVLFYCDDLRVDVIVFGLSEGEMAKQTKAFAVQLKMRTARSIVFQDETLTSHDAVFKMVDSGASRKKRQHRQHQVAAAIILQDYLDQHAQDERKNLVLS